LYSSNEAIGITGIIGSLIIMGIFTIFSRRWLFYFDIFTVFLNRNSNC
jgi:hypothetical protein